MNLTLAYCWKEWRAQRTTLLAYAGLVFASLCLGLSLAPTHAWFEESFGAYALSWFVIAGMLGVLLFVAPGLVQSEFGLKDDQFVRRLPGALAPAFRGKLLFLLLASVALPLVGLLLGELFVQAWGQDWNGLFRWRWDGTVAIDWPGDVVATALALLLAPWIWAIGCWLPRGRMAVGGTLLLVLGLGVAVTAVLRQSPKIEKGIDWQLWLWAVAPLGLGIAAASWAGRRGGGPLRSARFGLLAMGVGLLPPSAWLGACAWDYHHPDPANLASLDVRGLSPDGRYLLARGTGRRDWFGPTFRIDLDTGVAARIAGIGTGFGVGLVRPYVLSTGKQRYWLTYGEWGSGQAAYDLAADRWTKISYDPERKELELPAALRAAVLAERVERTLLRAPGGVRVWLEDTSVCFAEPDGSVTRVAVPELRGASVVPAGHGLFLLGGTNRTFDLTQRRLLPDTTSGGSAFLVRGILVYAIDTQHWRKWGQRAPGGEPQPVPALAQCRVLGLYDDDHLLVASWPNKQGSGGKPFLYRPADRSLVELPLPEVLSTGGCLEEWSPLFERGSLLARDPGSGVWLSMATNTRREFLRIDAASRVVTNPFGTGRDDEEEYQLLAFPDAGSALVRQGVRILRVEVGSGRARVLFPR